MPSWKKVITSGSNASLAQISASDLPAGGSHSPLLVYDVDNGGFQSLSQADYVPLTASYALTASYFDGEVLGDNLGNHTATEDLNMATFDIKLGDDRKIVADNQSNTYIKLDTPGSLHQFEIYSEGFNMAKFGVFGITFNEDGYEFTDFRVEGGDDENLFFIDAGEDKVAIGTNTVSPSLLTVDGDITTTHVTASKTVQANVFEIKSGSYSTYEHFQSINVGSIGAGQMDLTTLRIPGVNSISADFNYIKIMHMATDESDSRTQVMTTHAAWQRNAAGAISNVQFSTTEEVKTPLNEILIDPSRTTGSFDDEGNLILNVYHFDVNNTIHKLRYTVI